MVMRIDEAWHHNAAACIDFAGATGMQIRTDGENLLTIDEDVGLGKVADTRIH
jgi:hypothetical protein